MDQQSLYKSLVERYTSGKASTEELEVFFSLLKEGKLDDYLDASMRAQSGIDETETQAEAPVRPLPPRGHSRLFVKLIAAAVIAATISILVIQWFLPTTSTEQQSPLTHTGTTPVNDIPPGGNRAFLTLADGSTIILDSVANGTLAQEGNATITKTGDGKISYKQHAANHSQPITFNTLTTPRGGQYQLDLPDGTKVWVNAASTLRFPSHFSGTERLVELDGESYFEVAKNTHMPFRVKLKSGVIVEVLGTHFNINSYSSEPLKATLLEGSIKINTASATKVLSPGQAGTVNNTGNIHIEDADIEQAVAWKNGLFHFNRADIYTIMRQLERWYDVEVVFDKNIPQKEYVGKVSRNTNISEVLDILELSKIHFKIDGKKITVMP